MLQTILTQEKYMKNLLIGLALIAPAAALADLNQVATLIAKNKAGFDVSTKSSNEPIAIEIANGDGKIIASAQATPEEFVSAVRAQVPAQTLKAGGYTYTLNWEKMSVAVNDGSKDLYDILTDIRDHQSDPADNVGVGGYLYEDYKLLSAVGPIVSIRTSGNDYYPGAAHPESWDGFMTADGRKARAADGDMRSDLVTLVNEQSLLQALKADKALAKLISDKQVKKQMLAAKTMKELTDVVFGNVDNCYSFPGYDGQMQSFAIFDYDAKANLVSVRVSMGAAAHVCAAEAPTIQLGLKVKPNAEFEAMLRSQAQAHDGLLMKNAGK